MRPTFENAAKVWLEATARIRFGDILVYTNGEFLVVHRVVGHLGGGGYRTKGDGLPHLDRGLVPSERVLGRVLLIERDGRRYRTGGAGGRAYAWGIGLLSGVEGFLYRFAYRLDRLMTPKGARQAGTGERTTLRRALARGGRLVISLADRALFRRLHSRML
jgi:hypothetical protein